MRRGYPASMPEAAGSPKAGMLEGVVEVLGAMADKHGQVDLRIKALTLDFKGTPVTIELNGDVTVSLHMRELSPKEKRAHEDHTLRTLSR